MFKGQQTSGTVEGTGAALNVQLGFKPTRVTIFNEDGLCQLDWFNSMADNHGLKRITAGTMSKITSNGIATYDGTAAGEAAGFTIGADTDVNVNGETLHYEAWAEE